MKKLQVGFYFLINGFLLGLTLEGFAQEISSSPEIFLPTRSINEEPSQSLTFQQELPYEQIFISQFQLNRSESSDAQPIPNEEVSFNLNEVQLLCSTDAVNIPVAEGIDDLSTETDIIKLTQFLGEDSFDLREAAQTRIVQMLLKLKSDLKNPERFVNSLLVHGFLTQVGKQLLPPNTDAETRVRAARIIRHAELWPEFRELWRETKPDASIAIASAQFVHSGLRRLEASVIADKGESLVRSLQRAFGNDKEAIGSHDGFFGPFGFERIANHQSKPEIELLEEFPPDVCYRMHDVTFSSLDLPSWQVTASRSGNQYSIERRYHRFKPYQRFRMEFALGILKTKVTLDDILPFHVRAYYVTLGVLKPESLEKKVHEAEVELAKTEDQLRGYFSEGLNDRIEFRVRVPLKDEQASNTDDEISIVSGVDEYWRQLLAHYTHGDRLDAFNLE